MKRKERRKQRKQMNKWEKPIKGEIGRRREKCEKMRK